jgi:hypothetical protein
VGGVVRDDESLMNVGADATLYVRISAAVFAS